MTTSSYTLTGNQFPPRARTLPTNSPPGSVISLDPSRLNASGIAVWSLQEGNEVVGIGALKELCDGSGEVKSMRTHPDHLRHGVAASLLKHIVAEARARGWPQLGVENGTGPAFESVLLLYRNQGFVDREAFSNYRRSTFNQFLHLSL